MSRERLQLPEPAATLWRAVRDPLRRALASGGAAALLTLGGGTGACRTLEAPDEP